MVSCAVNKYPWQKLFNYPSTTKILQINPKKQYKQERRDHCRRFPQGDKMKPKKRKTKFYYFRCLSIHIVFYLN